MNDRNDKAGQKPDEMEWGARDFRSGLVQRGYDFMARDVWVPELTGLTRLRAAFYKSCRVLFLTARGFFHDRCLFRASALTYITILSLVPTLAFAFALAKGFGAYEYLADKKLDPFLDQHLGQAEVEPVADAAAVAGSPPGAQGLRQAIEQILDFVRQTDLSSLGVFGILILLYTVIKLLGTIERSFNEIFGVQRSRTLVRKVTDYIAMVIVAPIFLILAMTITSLTQSEDVVTFLRDTMSFGPAAPLILRWAALLLVWAGFTFVYLALPNTRTRVTSAILGGIVAGTIWQILQVVHVKFQVGMANYNYIYSSFAALPIFMVWIHISWAIVLFGAELAAAHMSEPFYRQIARARSMDSAMRQLIALRAVGRIARSFLVGEPPPTATRLAHEIGIPLRSLEEVLHTLCERELLVGSEGERGFAYLPARDLERIEIKDVLDALRGTSTSADLPSDDALDVRLDRHLQGVENAVADSSYNRTLRDLAQASLRDEESRAVEPGPALGLRQEPAN